MGASSSVQGGTVVQYGLRMAAAIYEREGQAGDAADAAEEHEAAEENRAAGWTLPADAAAELALLRTERDELKAENARLGVEVDSLRAELRRQSYEVQRDDFPAKIAEKVTGDAARWPELLDANPHKARTVEGIDGKPYRNFQSLIPGERLRLPESWLAPSEREAPPSLIPAPVDEGAGGVRERYLCGGCGKELGSPGAVREHAAELRRVAKSQRPGAPERAALEARAERLELDAREWEERDRKPSDPRQRADLYTWLALEELACSFADATDAKLAARARDHLRAAAAWLAVLSAERADGLSEGARVPVRIGRSVRTGTVEQQRGLALLVRIDFGPGRGAAFEWFDGETGKPIGRERHDVLGLDAARARWRLLVAEDDTAPDTERPPVASEPGACREVVSEEETELGSVRLYLEADTPEALEQAVRSARESLNLGGGR